MLVRIVSMLSKLVDRFSNMQVREDRAAYGSEDEEEDDKEKL